MSALSVGDRIRMLRNRYWIDENDDLLPVGTCGTVTRLDEADDEFDWETDDGILVRYCWSRGDEDGIFEIIVDMHTDQLTRILLGGSA